eukprot:3959673-Pleurochrysis_carterae.AAC.1
MKGQTKKRSGGAPTSLAIQVRSRVPLGQLTRDNKVKCRVGNLPPEGTIWAALLQTRTAQSILNGYH